MTTPTETAALLRAGLAAVGLDLPQQTITMVCKYCGDTGECLIGELLPPGWGWVHFPADDYPHHLEPFYGCPSCKDQESRPAPKHPFGPPDGEAEDDGPDGEQVAEWRRYD